MSSGAEAFGRRLSLYLRLSVWLTLLFLSTYAPTNWLAARRSHLLRLYWDWELAIPFVPWMIYVYLSVNVFLLAPLFVLDTEGIRRFAKAFALATLCGALAHLLLPAQSGWQRPARVAGYPLFDKLFALDLPYNLVPSLHVAYSVLAGAVIWNRTAAGWLRAVVSAWMALLIMSVLFAHQHHLVDALSGVVLGVACYQWLAARSGQ